MQPRLHCSFAQNIQNLRDISMVNVFIRKKFKVFIFVIKMTRALSFDADRELRFSYS